MDDSRRTAAVVVFSVCTAAVLTLHLLHLHRQVPATTTQQGTTDPAGRMLEFAPARPKTVEPGLSRAAPGCADIRLIWATGPETFGWLNVRSLESILRFQPCSTVTVYSDTLPVDFFRQYADAGFHVSVRPFDIDVLQEHGVGDRADGRKWARRLDEWRLNPHFAAHFSDFVRYAILYEHGGTYLDFDHIMVAAFPPHLRNTIGAELCMPDNVDCFWLNEQPQLATYGEMAPHTARVCAANGVLLSWEQHNPLLLRGLQYFDSQYNQQCWGCGGPRMFGREIPNFPTSVTLAAQQVFYPVTYREIVPTFAERDERILEKMKTSLGFHLFGKMTSNVPLRPNSTADVILARAMLYADEEAGVLQEGVAKLVATAAWPGYNPSGWMLSSGCGKGGGGGGGGGGSGGDGAGGGVGVPAAAISVASLSALADMLQQVSTFADVVSDVYAVVAEPNVSLADVEKLQVGVSCVAVYAHAVPGREVPTQLGRHVACLHSGAAACYFQDDSVRVGRSSVQLLLDEYRRDMLSVHALSSPATVAGTVAWRFFNANTQLHVGYVRLGWGSMISANTVRQFLCRLTSVVPDMDRRHYADAHFFAVLNTAPNVVEGEVLQLPRAWMGGARAHEMEIFAHALHTMASDLVSTQQAQRAVLSPTRFVTAQPVHGVDERLRNSVQWIAAAPTAAWATCHRSQRGRKLVALRTNMHSFPPVPTLEFGAGGVSESNLSRAPIEVAGDVALRDEAAGWAYRLYCANPLSAAVDGNLGTSFVARMGHVPGQQSRSVDTVEQRLLRIELESAATHLALQVCEEDGTFSFRGQLKLEHLVAELDVGAPPVVIRSHANDPHTCTPRWITLKWLGGGSYKSVDVTVVRGSNARAQFRIAEIVLDAQCGLLAESH